jgi:hypothetical protein
MTIFQGKRKPNDQFRLRVPVLKKNLLLALMVTGLSSTPAMAHIIPTDFGTFDGTLPVAPIALNGGMVGNFGWVDGADADWGDTHKLAPFTFTLTGIANVTLQFEKKSNAFGINGLVPGFSLYQGLPHSGAIGADHDYSVGSELIRTEDCAATPGCSTTEGSFRALSSWRITNDPDPTGTSSSVFTYIGSAYDGSQTLPATNSPLHDNNPYLIPGGDGLQDGIVSMSFANLGPGSYTVFVGGSVYSSQTNTASRGVLATFSLTPTAVPLPGAVWLFGSALVFTGLTGRRKSV